jgi:hypothetical protein
VRAEVALQREDLIAAARALESLEAPVAREVGQTKQVWPSLATGLPARPASLAPALAELRASATSIPTPSLFGEQRSRLLTGPAASIAGTFRVFASLAARGWEQIDAAVNAIEYGTRRNARFARANVALYIESVFDAHYALSQIGKKIHAAYDDLGGPQVFAKVLTQTQVDALQSFYSEDNERLSPRAGVHLGS